jgi:TolB-like protein
MADLMGIVERFKRHHMFRVASWYATVAYVLILGANAVFPDIGFTRGEVRYLIAGLALGFPIALVIGWTFVPPSKEEPDKLSQWQRARWRVGPALSILVVIFVGGSGTYLWNYNEHHEAIDPASSAAQVVAVLPFEHSGSADDAFARSLADQIDTTFSNLGVRLISNGSSPVLTDPKSSIADIAKATGATLVIRGSVHADPKEGYDVYFALISTADEVTLDSDKRWYSPKADADDVQMSLSSAIAERVHFLSVLDHYFAPGYATTRDAGALQLFRRGMLTYLDMDYVDGMQMLRAAVKLDPGFAQAHAYIAYYEAANPEPGVVDPKSVVEQELAAAEQKDPGMPEAVMARAARQFYLDEDVAGAIKTLEPVTGQLGNSFNLHMVYGHMLRKSGQMEQAQRQYQAASELDPYNQLAAQHVMRVGLALREYSDTMRFLSNIRHRWPLAIRFYLGQAQLRLSQDGDLAKFAGVVGDDLSSFGVTPKSPMVNMFRLEVAHLQGKHAQVIEGLNSLVMPEEGSCPDPFQMPQLSLQRICVVPFTAESLRLAGKDKEAAAYAKLHVPEFQRLAQKDLSDEMPGAANLALLEAFGGDPAALQSLAPLLKRLDAPVAKWSSEDGIESLDAAAVFAWCGESQKAVDMLAKSFDAPFGAHAPLVAIDPVWRPLYKTPAFAALLASHGVTLARAL